MKHSTVSSRLGLVNASKTAGPAQKGVSAVIPFCGREKSKYCAWTFCDST